MFCKHQELCQQSQTTEAALHKCSYKKVFWKHAANLQESIHAEVWF